MASHFNDMFNYKEGFDLKQIDQMTLSTFTYFYQHMTKKDNDAFIKALFKENVFESNCIKYENIKMRILNLDPFIKTKLKVLKNIEIYDVFK